MAVWRGFHVVLRRINVRSRQDERRGKLARMTSKRISADLRAVTQGTYKFAKLERLLAAPNQEEGEEEAKADEAEDELLCTPSSLTIGVIRRFSLRGYVPRLTRS